MVISPEFARARSRERRIEEVSRSAAMTARAIRPESHQISGRPSAWFPRTRSFELLSNSIGIRHRRPRSYRWP